MLCVFGFFSSINSVSAGISALLRVLFELRANQPGWGKGGGVSHELDAQQGRTRGVRWSLTHHLDAVQRSGCVYVYAYESRDGSVAGHQMVTVWAGPLKA